MSIDAFIAERGITEVLHYTTNSGLTGIVADRSIKCRTKLIESKYLEFIYKQTCPDRSRDACWHGHVNLSISRINARLFNIASDNWHSGLDGFWCIVSLSPNILTHPGVVFTTTNNIYPSCLRSEGVAGLRAMYRDPVYGRYGGAVRRHDALLPAAPTCQQAEVLYPDEIPFSYVQRIYFREAAHVDEASAIFEACTVEAPPLEVATQHFSPA